MTLSEGMLLVFQVVCLGDSLCRGTGWKSLYWAGAFALTVAVVKGFKT